MSKIMHRLRQEHRDYERLLDFLTHQLVLKSQADEPDYELVYDVMYYISHFPDRCHHPKEDVIYRKLCQRDPTKTNDIHRFLNEHQLLTAKSLAFFEAVKNVLNDSIQSFSEFSETAKAFIELQRQHIKHEEREVFPLIEQTLQSEDWLDLEKALHDLQAGNHFEREDLEHRKRLLVSIIGEAV